LTVPAGLDEEFIHQAAIDSGFMTRAPRKIPPRGFFKALCDEVIQGSPSYNDLAARIEADTGVSASRQALGARMNEACHRFIQRLLGRVMSPVSSLPNAVAHARPRPFSRVLVHDSTVLKLPGALSAIFSGVANAHASVCNARVQATYDLVPMRFLAFSIDPYSKNDASAAPQLEIKAGDLVLRDRGYLTAGEIQRHADAGADCIYRHKTGITYLDAATHRPLDLLDHLRRHGRADMPVLLNNAARTPVRLVAAPVDRATADARRMKAKKEMRGHAPGQTVLALMDWTIFITTIPAGKASFSEVLAWYGLRWRIEVIFKAWKSHLKFAAIHRVSGTQLQILLKTRLLLVAAWANTLYGPCLELVRHRHRRELSLLKFTRYLAANPAKAGAIFQLLSGCPDPAEVTRVLARYCCYDKRKRRNFNQTWEALALS
jgi:hypothetical protein